MANRRGRPTGFKLSEESKAKISKSKTGQTHTPKTRRKISKSVRFYFKTPKGRAQRAKTAAFMIDFWNSPEGMEYRLSLGDSMKSYYEGWKETHE